MFKGFAGLFNFFCCQRQDILPSIPHYDNNKMYNITDVSMLLKAARHFARPGTGIRFFSASFFTIKNPEPLILLDFREIKNAGDGT